MTSLFRRSKRHSKHSGSFGGDEMKEPEKMMVHTTCNTVVNVRCKSLLSSSKLSSEQDSYYFDNMTPNLSPTESFESDNDDGDTLAQSKSTTTSSSDDDDVDVDPIEIVLTGPSTMEPITGISFPAILNGYQFVGCGVRTKYLVVHAYAVGMYLHTDPVILGKVKTEQDRMNLLLDPYYPRIFRLVMNRNVTSNQYIAVIMEALLPLLRGKDVDKLQVMKTMSMPPMLKNKSEIYLMVKDGMLTVQVNQERAGIVRSPIVAGAVCENYLANIIKPPASPALEKEVLQRTNRLLPNLANQC